MKQKIVVLVLALLLVGTFGTAAVAMTRGDDKADGKKDDKASHGKRHGHGPPPWANGPRRDGKHHGKPGKPDKAWRDHWKSLSPTERADKMAELAQQHADGMKAWAACVKAAGDDRAKRAACERPLPPGHAKKMLR